MKFYRVLIFVFVSFLFLYFAEKSNAEDIDVSGKPVVARIIEGGSLTRWYDIDGDGNADLKVTYRFAKKDGNYVLEEISREVSALKSMTRR